MNVGEMLKAIAADEAKNIVILDELRDLLDDLHEKSSSELEASIKAEGVRDAIVIWKEKKAIVDGHNRFRIAQKLSVPFTTREISFASVEEAKQWMLRNQLGRRNLTKDRFDYLIGKLYNETKQADPANRTKLEDGHTAEKIAKEHGVSERTVRRAADFASGVDVIERIKGKAEKAKQLSGQGSYTKEEVKEIAKVAQKTPEKASVMVAALDRIKQKVSAKQPLPAKQEKTEVYNSVYCQPDFTMAMNAIEKPSLDKNSIVYLVCEDEYLSNAMKLIDRWGLEYDGSMVFVGEETYEGMFTKVKHTMVLIASKGTVIGPKAGKEPFSVQNYKGDLATAILTVVEPFSQGKKLDMRVKPHKGWEG